MLRRVCVVIGLGLLLSVAFAKDKKKAVLPAYVLAAHNVAVIIDPQAGVSIDEPMANEIAQKDVETALLNWGRFNPVLSSQNADLIIVVRKGNGRLTNETIRDPRQNNRPGAINPTDNGGAIGAQHGASQGIGSTGSPGEGSPGPQMEIGGEDDSLVVYQAGDDRRSITGAAAWRYVGKDGLLSPSVPAVAAFKKAVADAEKAAAARNP